jgi:hypothetical protein
MKEAAAVSKPIRNTLLLSVLVMVSFAGCLLWFGLDYGADLRKAAYFGHLSKVQSILKSHPRVVGSYRPHPEAIINNAQRKGAWFSKWLWLRFEWAKLRDFLRQKLHQQHQTQRVVWDEAGISALDLAVESNRPEIVCLLLDYGADYAHLNAGNMTAFQRAILLGRLELVKQFLAHRCDLEVPDRSGGTALWWAVLCQKREIAELLLAHGAKVDGNTNEAPIQAAALVNGKAIAGLLITHGAQINITNRWNETPPTVAIRRGNTEVSDILREHGAHE